MSKTLKTKRVFVYAIYNNLRMTPPKDYPTVQEIKSTINSILPALKEAVSGYLDLFKKVEALGERIRNDKDLPEAESKKLIDAMNAEWKEYNQAHGNDLVEVALDEEGMKTLKGQFERDKWGKNWIATIEEYSELLDAFAEAVK